MSDREAALARIRQIARENGLGVADVVAALGAGDDNDSGSRVVVRVLSYIGAAFVFAGIGTFIAMHWEDFNSAARVVVSLGSGLALFALALIALRDTRYRVAATPLFIVAAALIPTGLMVGFHEYGSGDDWRVAWLITAATVALQYALTYLKYRRTVLVFFAIAFAVSFWTVALEKIGVDAEFIALTVGAMLMMFARGLQPTDHGSLSPLGYFFGSWGFLMGLFEIVQHTLFELLFLLTACGFVYLGVLLRSRTLNFVSTLAILGYTGYFTGEHFADSIGWPLALIAFGLAMIGIGAVGVRIDRKYLRS